MLSTLLLLTCLSPAPLPPEGDPVTQKWSFDSEEEPPWSATATGDGAKRNGTGPKREDGELVLLQPWWKLQVSTAFPAPAEQPARILECSWTQQLARGTEGIGFAWASPADHGEDGLVLQPEAWEAPTLPASFSIGFDASDPPNLDPFRGSGNIHNRPEHEISVHWAGEERFKKLTETDFRDEEPHRIALRVEWVPGGAIVDLTLDEEVVFDRWFLAGATPYAGRAAFGGNNQETAGWAAIDELEVTCAGLFDGFEEPLEIVGLERVLNDAAHGRNEATVTFPEVTGGFERILLDLRLDKPETRFDPWDRIANVYVLDDQGEQVELLRYITPYHKGGHWLFDVTDFRPLLTGARTLVQACGTQGEGWVVSVTFLFYPGTPERLAHRVIPMWEGQCVIGDPEQPTTGFFEPRRIELDEITVGARVRSVVTGHGMAPNSENAAEFMPLGRTLTVNGTASTNLLWKTDNYLNPCRPQGGTWKYDRAGWAPGDVVRPWLVEVAHEAIASGALEIGYAPDDFVNENRGQTWSPFHQVAAHLVLYRAPISGTRALEEQESAKARAKPNVLIIQTDEHNFRTLGCYRETLSEEQALMWGPDVVETPSIDWLAETGALCTSFYATSPVCAPSRAALVSGCYPQNTGVVANNDSLDDDVVTFAEVLRRSGWATGYSGKWHLDGKSKPGWAPERRFGFEDNRFQYNRGHWKQLELTEEGPRVKARNDKGKPSYSVDGADEISFTTDFLADRTIEFIEAHAEEPFCYMVSFPDPHGPDTVRHPYDRMFYQQTYVQPRTFDGPKEGLPSWALSNGKFTEMSRYYGMVRCIDDNVGRILDALRERGLIENTMVIFTADHGDLRGEHHRQNKGVPFEASAKIPFIVRYPGRIAAGTRIDEALGTVDFKSTLCGLLGVAVEGENEGRDASSLLLTGEAPKSWKDITFLRRSGRASKGWLAAVSDRYKLVVAPEDEPWLYDLEEDPDELINFFDVPTHRQAVKALAGELRRYGATYDDPYARHPDVAAALTAAAGESHDGR